jgi:hypothetical protein
MSDNNNNPAAPSDSAAGSPRSTSSPVLIAAAWLLVGIPAAWGVAQTFKTSLKLFQAPPPAPTAPAGVK